MSWDQIIELIISIVTTQSGIPNLLFKQMIMMGVAFFFLYLAVAKKYEPLLLVPIGFGIFLVNFPLVPLMGFTEHGAPELIRVFYKYGAGGHDRFQSPDRQPQDTDHRCRSTTGRLHHLYRGAVFRFHP
jgi:hypothetical protein